MNDLCQRLWTRISQLMARGHVVDVDDGSGLQVVRFGALSDEIQEAERAQNYGFSSVPFVGADAFVLYGAGNRDNPVVMVVDDRKRRKDGMQPGEVSVYDDQGQVVHLRRNGIVVEGQNVLIKSPGVIRIEGDKVEINGKTYVQEDVDGFGQRTTSDGGGFFTVDNYTDGASVTNNSLGIDPPDIPSEHP